MNTDEFNALPEQMRKDMLDWKAAAPVAEPKHTLGPWRVGEHSACIVAGTGDNQHLDRAIWQARCEDAEKQRDELLAACQEAIDRLSDGGVALKDAMAVGCLASAIARCQPAEKTSTEKS